MIRALALALSLAALPAAAFDVEAMRPAEREAFQAEIRDYLLENPEVIVEAIGVLEAREAVSGRRVPHAGSHRRQCRGAVRGRSFVRRRQPRWRTVTPGGGFPRLPAAATCRQGAHRSSENFSPPATAQHPPRSSRSSPFSAKASGTAPRASPIAHEPRPRADEA